MDFLTRRAALVGLGFVGSQSARGIQQIMPAEPGQAFAGGLFVTIQQEDIPADVKWLRTSGYAQAGVGGGLYRVIDTPDRPFAATAWLRQSRNGRWVAFAEPDVTPDQLGYGLDPVGALRAYRSLQRATGAHLVFEPKIYKLPSASLGSEGIILSDGAVIEGRGATIEVVGNQICNIWDASNCSNVKVRDLVHIGNNLAAVYGAGSAFIADLRNDSKGDMVGLEISGCRFENFRANYWIRIINESDKFHIENPRVFKNKFYSRPGNALDGKNRGMLAACIAIMTSSNQNSRVNAPYVADNFADIPHIKTFCAFYTGVIGGRAERNEVMRCGTDDEISNDGAAYAFLVYDQSNGINPPDDCAIVDCKIHDVRSAGIYAAGARRLDFDVWVGRQTDPVNTSIPKGAVALNGVLEGRGHLRAENCVFAFSFVTPQDGATCEVDLECHNCKTGMLYGSSDGFQVKRLVVSRFLATNVQTGLAIRTNAEATIQEMSLKNLDIDASGWGVDMYILETPPVFQKWTVTGVLRNGGFRASGYNGRSGEIVLQDLSFEGDSPQGESLCMISDCTNVVLDKVNFTREPRNGFCLATPGTVGRMTNARSVRFKGGSRANRISPDSRLGHGKPDWMGREGDLVQMIDKAGTQTAYQRHGEWVVRGT